MRKLATALVGLLAFAANAQNLTKAEEGRVAIASCYANCMARGERMGLAAVARLDRLTDLALSPQVGALSQSQQAALFEIEEENFCLLAQEHVRNAEACHVGCVDLEVAYDVRSSHARNRFNQALQDDMAALRDAGLWTNYRNSPDPGTAAFSRACQAYLSDDGASGFMPKRVRPADLAASNQPKQPEPKNE